MSPEAGVVVVGDIGESLGVRPAKEACGAVAAVHDHLYSQRWLF